MEVIINKAKHIDEDWQKQYMNPWGCPLYRAIKEQHPDFPLERISILGMVIPVESRILHPTKETPWSSTVLKKFMQSEEQNYLVKLAKR